jgi:hypothetical protein
VAGGAVTGAVLGGAVTGAIVVVGGCQATVSMLVAGAGVVVGGTLTATAAGAVDVAPAAGVVVAVVRRPAAARWWALPATTTWVAGSVPEGFDEPADSAGTASAMAARHRANWLARR